MYKENDVVRVKSSHPDEGVFAGQAGTIICVFEVPNEAYEVEFVGDDGVPWVQLTLQPDELEPLV